MQRSQEQLEETAWKTKDDVGSDSLGFVRKPYAEHSSPALHLQVTSRSALQLALASVAQRSIS